MREDSLNPQLGSADEGLVAEVGLNQPAPRARTDGPAQEPEPQRHVRTILLNNLFSESKTHKAHAGHREKPPIHSADELLQFLRHRADQQYAIEFFDTDKADEDDDALRIRNGQGFNFIRINKLQITEAKGARYATLLIDAVDYAIRTMPVLHTVTMEGRDLAGEEHERGVFSAHVVIKLPTGDDVDDGIYRCAIEVVAGITRRQIGTLFRRQLRRIAKINGFQYEIEQQGKRGLRKPKIVKYRPDLTLVSDVRRSFMGQRREITQMVFTKRSEKVLIAEQIEVLQDDIFADVELRIHAKNAPKDEAERIDFWKRLKQYHEERGFKTRLYFKQLGGKVLSGTLHEGLDAAADLLLCPHETITTDAAPRRWVKEIQPDVRDAMMALVDRDDLWKRSAG